MRVLWLVAILTVGSLLPGCCCVIPMPWNQQPTTPTAPANTSAAPASPLRSDVSVKLNKWSRPSVGALPGAYLICNVTVTNRSNTRLEVVPESIRATVTDGAALDGDTGRFLPADGQILKERYGQTVKMLVGVLAPGQSVTGDVIFTASDESKPLSMGFKR